LNHPASNSLLDLTLGDLLERLGSSDPSPGGGAAAALAGALGAALVQMTANLSIGRPRLADVEEQARSIEDRAGDLCQQLAGLGDADSAAFDEVSAAYRLPRADDAQKAARTQAIQSALRTAAAVPMQTARLCAEVLAVAEEAAPILNPAVISDVVVGALLTQAALESAAINVEINLAVMTDAAAVQRLSDELVQIREGTPQRAQRVVEIGRLRFPKT
jgi:formiminotetrahydrofolate cyclodeaminase